MTTLLYDADVRALLTPQLAVASAREALVDAHRGRLDAPPRIHADLGDAALVFTAGGMADGTRGVRSTRRGASPPTRPCSSGTATAAWRGASSASSSAPPAPARSAGRRLIGSRRRRRAPSPSSEAAARRGRSSGRRPPSRSISQVRVHSPTERHRERFAERARAELGLAARAVPDASDAVDGAEIVILATRSETPVIETAWVRPGAHVTTVGPKAAGRTDSSDLTLYASTGLAGSEVVMARRLLETAA